MAERKRAAVVVFIFPLIVGIAAFSSVTRRPQFESYRTLDVIQLLGAGVCFGVAMTLLIVTLVRPRG